MRYFSVMRVWHLSLFNYFSLLHFLTLRLCSEVLGLKISVRKFTGFYELPALGLELVNPTMPRDGVVRCNTATLPRLVILELLFIS